MKTHIEIIGFEMIGILMVLAAQSPFVESPPCKAYPNESNSSLIIESTSITQANTFWDDQIYVIFACLITIIFIIGNLLLIIFVKEIDGLSLKIFIHF